MRSRCFEAEVINRKIEEVLESDAEAATITVGDEKPKITVSRGVEELRLMEDVLAACKERRSLSSVSAKLGFRKDLTANYMDYMVEQGLLNWKDGTYVATRRGKRLLNLFRRLQGFFGSSLIAVTAFLSVLLCSIAVVCDALV
jgi:predicted transcriptional regulator